MEAHRNVASGPPRASGVRICILTSSVYDSCAHRCWRRGEVLLQCLIESPGLLKLKASAGMPILNKHLRGNKQEDGQYQSSSLGTLI